MSGISEERRAEILRDNTRHACRQADLADRTLMGSSSRAPEEDEDGFVTRDNYRIPGMVWKRLTVEDDPPKRTPYRPDLPLPWLEGRAS